MGIKKWVDSRFPPGTTLWGRGQGGLQRFTNNVRDSGSLFTFGQSLSGQRVDERTALQISTVYACVRLLSESMASLPLRLYENDTMTDGSVRRSHHLAYNHPLYPILYQQPNIEMTKFSFIEVIMMHLLLWGNAYAYIERNQLGEVLSLYPMLPEFVEVDRVDNDLVYTYHAYTDERPGETGKDLYFRRDQILHIPGLSFNGLVGFSPIAMQKNGLGTVLAVDAYGSEYFKNGGQLKGVITLDHPVKDFERLRRAWNAAYGNGGGMHGTAILEEGAKYQNISLPPEDSQFLATRKYGVEEICRIFRVPPHLVQFLDKASYASIEEQGIDFATYTLAPWAERISAAIVKDVLREDERNRYYVEFNLNSLQRGNYEARMRGYATARSNGWMSMNDIRDLEGLNPYPDDLGGEDILINGSYVKVQDVGIAYGQNAMAEREKQAGNNEEQEDNSKGLSRRKAQRKAGSKGGGS